MRHTTHQGTVAGFDEATRSGSVIDDSGYTQAFGGDALSAEVRLLRPGQRVRWELEPSGKISRLSLVTL